MIFGSHRRSPLSALGLDSHRPLSAHRSDRVCGLAEADDAPGCPGYGKQLRIVVEYVEAPVPDFDN